MKLLLSSSPSRRILIALFSAVSTACVVQTASAADAKPTIPIIVKDTTSNYWQIVLAGARKAGKDLNVTVPELGAQSESDINGQISILENAVSEKPTSAAIRCISFTVAAASALWKTAEPATSQSQPD